MACRRPGATGVARRAVRRTSRALGGVLPAAAPVVAETRLAPHEKTGPRQTGPLHERRAQGNFVSRRFPGRGPGREQGVHRHREAATRVYLGRRGLRARPGTDGVVHMSKRPLSAREAGEDSPRSVWTAVAGNQSVSQHGRLERRGDWLAADTWLCE